MNSQNIIFVIIGCILVGIGAILLFIFKALSLINSPAVAGIIGVLVGGFAGLLGSIVTSIVGMWRVSKDAEERLNNRISNHALELTRLDYELRQKSLDLKELKNTFWHPLKYIGYSIVPCLIYTLLLDLHTTGNWPKEVQDEGLLSIFELGSRNFEGKRE